eukprot:TRINITY_DN20518_c0_g1_i2.p1 TRINITY_DN20518_c0_g1~~TRINITY_DN20518_c0_g1_i2.p1  ORF type:complete len:287 (+),score=51.79 TRINITY_DN20518_c0_g1_i2:336-1196(+)
MSESASRKPTSGHGPPKEVDVDAELPRKFSANAEILPPDGHLFSRPIKQWERFPVVHLEGDMCPSPDNAPRTRGVLDRLIPMVKGIEGYYGAGGGMLHVLYFSKEVESESKWSRDNLPSCDELLETMQISKAARKNLQWYNCLDMTHQTLFPRHYLGEDDVDLLVRLEQMIAEVDPEAPVLGMLGDGPYLGSHIRESFSEEVFPGPAVRMMYLGVVADGLHDADCAKLCPRDDSFVISRSSIKDHHRLLTHAGDIFENPRFALFQTSEGHIVGLLTMDYLDKVTKV